MSFEHTQEDAMESKEFVEAKEVYIKTDRIQGNMVVLKENEEDTYYFMMFVELKEGDEGYNDKVSLFNFRWIPNGTHGKVTPYLLTKYIEIYPEKWDGEWEDWPRLKLHFKYGKLQDYEDITGQR